MKCTCSNQRCKRELRVTQILGERDKIKLEIFSLLGYKNIFVSKKELIKALEDDING